MAGMELYDAELVLRPPSDEDIPAVAAACRDPEIARFIPFVPTPYEEDDARRWLEGAREAWRTTPERTFTIVDGDRNEFLGVVTVRLVEFGTVGYWLAPHARGRGVMTRAVSLVVDWARRTNGIRTL